VKNQYNSLDKKKIKNNTIKAGKGKVFRRIADGFMAGNTLYLGKTYYVAGKLLDKPLDELPEHYEEIDEVVIDEEHPVVAPLDEVVAEIPAETDESVQVGEALPEQEEVIQKKEPVVITVQDIVSMAEKMEKIYNLLTPEQKEELKQSFISI
jgi:hypothetical protein